MNRLSSFVLVSTVLLMTAIPISHALEILRWERLPVTVSLVVGHERVIFVDRNVRVGIPPSVSDRLRVQSAGGALYLRASGTIESTRLQLQDADTGALILLDVFAAHGEAPLEPLRIVDGESPATRYGDAGQLSIEAQPTATRGPSRETPIPVMLTRYAAQSLYAPLRTVEAVSGITRVNLRGDLALNTLLPTLPVRARALGAWRLEDQWVTAIRLTNTSMQWLELDPRGLQGDFVAATFQHPDLGPAGDSTDTTVVYLVTRGHGLAESLLPAISAIDASLNLPATAGLGRLNDVEGARDAE